MRASEHRPPLRGALAVAAVGFPLASVVSERVLYAGWSYPDLARPGFISPGVFVILYAPVLVVCALVGRRCRTGREVLAAAVIAGLAGAGVKAGCAALGVEGFPPLPEGLAAWRWGALQAARIGFGYAVFIGVVALGARRCHGSAGLDARR